MQVPEHVRAAGDRPLFNHRSSQMTDLLSRLEAGCRPLFGTQGDVVFLAASGTGAMESAVVNLTSPGEEVIVIVGGTFASRWSDIAKSYGVTVRTVDADWRQGVTLTQVEQALQQHPKAEVVFHTWSESSTGVLNDMADVGKLLRSRNKIYVADAVSGLAVSPMSMDNWNIDLVIAGSQKGLMVSPGLGVVAIGARAWEKSSARRHRAFISIGKN
jgi:aspartate aminotransferase-like enzyme